MPLDNASRAVQTLEDLGVNNDRILAHITPREAAILRAFGGSGARNPDTGLMEFDSEGSGGGDNTGPTISAPFSGQPTFLPGFTQVLGPTGGQESVGRAPGIYDAQGNTVGDIYSAVDFGTPATRDWVVSQQYGPDYVGKGVAPLDPATFQNIYKSSLNLPFGGSAPPIGTTDSPFNATAGNPNYTINSSGYAELSPTGQQAFRGALQTQEHFLKENARKNASGIAGFAGTPLGGLSFLGIPFAAAGIGAGLEALGGLGAGAGAGEATTAGAASTAAQLGSLGDISSGLDAASLGSGAGFAAGLPETAGGALGGSALDAATTLGSGVNDLAGGSIGISPGATPDLAGGIIQPPSSVAASPELASSGPIQVAGPSAASISPNDLFLGASSSAPAGTVDASTAAAAVPGAEAPLGPGGGAASTGAAGESGGFFSSAKDILKTIGDFATSPYAKLGGVALSGLQLLNNMGKANNIPGTSNLQQIAQNAQSQGQILQNYLNTGTLPPAVQASVDQATADGITAIKSRYASMGIAPNSTQEAQDIARLKQNAVVQGATLADQLLQQGISLSGLSAQIYGELVNQNSALNAQNMQAINALATALAGGGTTLRRAA